MKVLFAVSNEEISESIVKKYQKDYKEIISNKNVYYFNAILKELQKDKTYDRIVISEDLEAFTNAQYDQIDKFIFEMLDSISDEASNSRGNDIPIILICSDRRTKSEQLLVKLFGIGIYNAIIGNDRSIDEVCNLIRKPRVKKEAKVYYKIDTEEVNYQAENENDVSEMEIQNIVAHYRRLGRNEDKFIESFNNIAAQYNDTQLRIITKFLPINVRAVLEERCPKYQQVMSFNNSVSNNLRNGGNRKEEKQGTSEKLLTQVTKEKNISEPIIIPSSVNMQSGTKLAKKKPVVAQKLQPIEDENEEKIENLLDINNNEKDEEEYINKTNKIEMQNKSFQEQQTFEDLFEDIQDIDSQLSKPVEDIVEKAKEQQENSEPKKRGRGRPRKNPLPDNQEEPKVKRGRGRPRKNSLPEEENQIEDYSTGKQDNDESLQSILPGFDELEYKPEEQNESNYDILSSIEEPNDINKQISDDYDLLQGFDDEEENKYNSSNSFDMLPGFEEDAVEEKNNDNFSTLPGFENDENDESDSSISELDNEMENREEQEENYFNTLPEVEEDSEIENYQNNSNYTNQSIQNDYNSYSNENYQNSINKSIKEKNYESTIDLSSLLTPDKKIVSFVGTSKNGTSFIVNNLAEYMSSQRGIKTAILDTTQNRNSYYIYTKNEEQLRVTAANSIQSLARGVAQGINVNKNLTIYTSLPDENESIEYVDEILETMLKNYSLILIDTDFDTPIGYFKQSQETYLVQTYDILTIQPLTAFLRDLKSKNILDEKKLKIILNKTVNIRGITDRAIIGGMAYYNDPAMSFMTELFDRNTIKYISMPFEQEIYTKYLQGIIECEITLKGYSKTFMQNLKVLSNMVYSGVSTNNKYVPPSQGNVNGNIGGNNFSANMNTTLEQMRRNY